MLVGYRARYAEKSQNARDKILAGPVRLKTIVMNGPNGKPRCQGWKRDFRGFRASPTGMETVDQSRFAGTITVGTVALRIMPSATLPSSRDAITPWPWEPSTTMSALVSFT